MLNLSIVVITKDNPEELNKTLLSIPSSLAREVVIINAGKYNYSQSDFPHVQLIVINESDHGISDAWNKGIKASTQKYIFILNSGDELLETRFFNHAIPQLESDANLGFVHGNLIFDDSIAGKIIQRPQKQSLGRGMPFLVLATVFRRSIFDQIGFFDLKYKIAMDYDWALRASILKIHSVHIDIPVILMDGKGVSSKQEWRGIQECYKSIQTHYPASTEIRLAYALRVFLYGLRKFSLALGMSWALAAFKRIKHGQ